MTCRRRVWRLPSTVPARTSPQPGRRGGGTADSTPVSVCPITNPSWSQERSQVRSQGRGQGRSQGRLQVRSQGRSQGGHRSSGLGSCSGSLPVRRIYQTGSLCKYSNDRIIDLEEI